MSGDQTFYADLRQLRQWFRNTAPGGERAIYAVGPALDPNAEVVKQVIAWRESGDVVTIQARVGGRLNYLVGRTRRERVGEASIPAALASTIEGRMFAAVDHAARHTLPCPSYSELADMLGLRDKQAAAHRFRKLISAGLIRCQEVSGRRVVTIVETGASTASGVAAA